MTGDDGNASLNNQQELEAQTGRESYLLAEAGANPGSAGVVGKRDGALLVCEDRKTVLLGGALGPRTCVQFDN